MRLRQRLFVFALTVLTIFIALLFVTNTTMGPSARVAAVSGGNKGIGFAIVRQLALQYPKSSFNTGPLLIYLTARDKGRGEEALKNIKADAQLQKTKALSSQGGLTEVRYLPLDIDSSESINGFAEYLKKEHPEGIDFLINNAGIAMNGFDSNVVKKTLHCNYYGTLQAMEQLLPHIRDGGRVVNVASQAGQLSSKYSETITKRFRGAKKTDEVTTLMEEFTQAVENNSYTGNFPGAAYAVSKAGVIGMTRTMAWQNAGNGSKTLINVCCPGYVKTDMTRGGGAKTPDEGAQTPVLLALGDIQGSNGDFWKDEKVLSW